MVAPKINKDNKYYDSKFTFKVTFFILFIILFFVSQKGFCKQNLNFKKNPHRKKQQIPEPTPTATPSALKDLNSSNVGEIIYPQELGKDISEAVVLLANRLDSFFGEPRGDDEKNGSTLRITPSMTFYNDRPNVSEFGFNLNLKFKNLEKKAKKIEQTIKEEIENVTKSEEDSKGKNASLSGGAPSRIKTEQEEWNYNFESKMLVRPAIYYSGKFRVRRDFIDQEFFIHHFALSAGWDTDDAWSQLTSVHSDHAISENVLLRFSNEVNWYISLNSFQTYHGPTILHNLNKYNSVSYSFRGIFGIVNGNYQRLDSPLSLDFRNGTPSKRIFIDIIPMLSYPYTKSYKEVRSIQVKLEYLFGDVN